MDANRLRFHMLADAQDWLTESSVSDGEVCLYDAKRKTLRLGSLGETRTFDEELDLAELEPRLARVPGAVDAFGTWAWWDSASGQVRAAGGGAGSTLRFEAAQVGLAGAVTDLSPGAGGVLYVAVAQRVVALHLRKRWSATVFPAEGLTAHRIASDPRGGAYVLSGPPSFAPAAPPAVLGRVDGQPLPDVLSIPSGADLFRPAQENPDPPRTRALATLAWPGEVPVALACDSQGRLAVLSWVMDAALAGVPADAAYARLRFYTSRFSAPLALPGVLRPFSLAFLPDGRAAVLSLLDDGKVEAVAYALPAGASEAIPQGDFFPLPGHDGGPFLQGAQPPHHAVAPGLATAAPVPLQALSLPRCAERGRATNPPNRPFDSGDGRTVWHRLYLEALLPPRTGVRVWLAATDEPLAPTAASPLWHEHRFGVIPEPPVHPNAPHGSWVPMSSEVPFQPGMLPAPPSTGESGLFTVLIQRAHTKVRALSGRYLWVRVELFGDGRRTPEVGALRAYASRFSYVDHYLPSLYREDLFGEDADAPGRASHADFLERFLGIVEGVLTPIEDRIAQAHVLTDPSHVPSESLEWLASWVGLSFDPLLGESTRRAMLRAAPALSRRRGCIDGLRLALDLVTDGAVSRGALVVVEDFRLRRTLATILGADLADEEDPLLPGLSRSGNSFVGDTLFLGDETREEFLAVFGDETLQSPTEAAAVEAFLERLAHRLTVLVHQGTDTRTLGLIRKVAEQEAPAHVQVSVITASRPLLVGVASLVGVDTFTGPAPAPTSVRVGHSVLGLSDVIERPSSLDPRLEGG